MCSSSERFIGVFNLRQIRPPHQVLVHALRGLTAFGDGPDDQGLAAGHVARGEDARNACHLVLVGPNIATLRELEAKLLNRARLLRAKEPQREKDKITIDLELA